MESAKMNDKLSTEAEYDDFLSGEDLKAIYYSSQNCGVCNTMKPQVIKLFKAHHLSIREISINELRELAAQQLILKSPTLIIYENRREILRSSGFIDLNRLNEQIERMLS
jgi:thiol-disulfide isomerase/thioredoxin